LTLQDSWNDLCNGESRKLQNDTIIIAKKKKLAILRESVASGNLYGAPIRVRRRPFFHQRRRRRLLAKS